MVIKTYVLVVGLIALVANIWVLFFSATQIRPTSHFSTWEINRFFVMHIAFADLIMAVSLITIGITAFRYHGRYCMYSLRWRTSTICNLIGVSTLTSMLVTVNLLLVLTLFRLYGIANPLKSCDKYFSKKKCWLIVTSMWLVALFISLAPVAAKKTFQKLVFLSKKSPFFEKLSIDPKQVFF